MFRTALVPKQQKQQIHTKCLQYLGYKTLHRSKKMGTKVGSTQTILFYTLSFIDCSLWAFVVDIATTALVNSM